LPIFGIRKLRCYRKQTSVTQIEHLLQTAEAIRRDGKPEWMQVVGLVHDLGKLLATFQPEWVIQKKLLSLPNSSIHPYRTGVSGPSLE